MSDPNAGSATTPPFVDKIAWVHLVDRRLLVARSFGRELFYVPGGKREPGESDVETLVREIHEELGVRLDPASAVHRVTVEAPADGRPDSRPVRLTCYTADAEGEVAPSREIEELAWVGSADADRVSAANRLVLDHLRDTGLLD
ncbi:DNA mismatch repair protein MutT [Terrabacter tumescens]|uniref:DNA mismatch repair protein MutT n=1 Tax=Terrabacter tumescens TaxID=60443 RepID=A0ABQ2HFH4_9MICO|nr:NUDIX domain-containing protein [Terrabacter tumescens]GGM79974.1 DNA mismatch repair protein MutT [Terrabacter tumescens]